MFTNMRVRSRLTIILVVSAIALLGVGVLGLINGHRTALEIDNVYYGGVDKLELLFGLETDLNEKVLTPVYKFRDNIASASEASNSIRQARDSFIKTWNHYSVENSYLQDNNVTPQQAIMNQLQPAISTMEAFLTKLTEALDQQDKQQVESMVTRELYPSVDPVMLAIKQLVQIHSKDTLSDYQDGINNAFWFQMTTLAGLLLSLAILVPLTIAIMRSVVKPIEYASERVASGDTKAVVEITSGGELGQLLQSIKSMFQSLDKVGTVLQAISVGDLTVEGSLRSDRDVLGHTLHNMVTQMRSMIGDIKAEVNALTSSSQEIMTSLNHISTGATETASAVTETTTTIEELKQTANISVDKAQDVLGSAEETLQSVQASEESVLATIQDMNQIRERMQVISDAILQLSEKSSAIAEIMDTVNDIAEQSNLLAVNAAIEAAKAGEVGRSFGVVAQEIRTLAEQSKGATIQVKALLGDIQTATGSAVIATEQGSKAVSKGVEQSTRTNKAMKELATKMKRVNQAANQIVLSNQQQLIGTEQITVAMGQISEATVQHADHLKQIELAVSTLNQVSETLKGLTDRYRIADREYELPISTPTVKPPSPQPNKRLAPRTV